MAGPITGPGINSINQQAKPGSMSLPQALWHVLKIIGTPNKNSQVGGFLGQVASQAKNPMNVAMMLPGEGGIEGGRVPPEMHPIFNRYKPESQQMHDYVHYPMDRAGAKDNMDQSAWLGASGPSSRAVVHSQKVGSPEVTPVDLQALVKHYGNDQVRRLGDMRPTVKHYADLIGPSYVDSTGITQQPSRDAAVVNLGKQRLGMHPDTGFARPGGFKMQLGPKQPEPPNTSVEYGARMLDRTPEGTKARQQNFLEHGTNDPNVTDAHTYKPVALNHLAPYNLEPFNPPKAVNEGQPYDVRDMVNRLKALSQRQHHPEGIDTLPHMQKDISGYQSRYIKQLYDTMFTHFNGAGFPKPPSPKGK